MRIFNPYRIVLIGTALWCLMLVAPPFISLVENNTHAYSHAVIRFFSPVCHQLDDRSFHLFGMKFAVCSRCFGIYSGFFLGVVFYPFRSRKNFSRTSTVWAIGIIPMLTDVALDLFGLHESTLVTRLWTGLLFGIVASIILTPLFLEGMTHLFQHSSTNQGITHESKA